MKNKESQRIKERINRKEKRVVDSSDKIKSKNVKRKETSDININSSMVEKVITRNMVAYSNYRKLISLTFLNIFIAIVSIFTAYNFYSKPIEPRYVPMSMDGKIIPNIPLNEPNLNDGAVMEFALNAARDINMYDYENWKAQLTSSQNYFTLDGWNSFLSEFQRANTINTVKKEKMVVNMRPISAPSIIRQGKINFDKGEKGEVYVWIVEIPSEVRYISNDKGISRTNPMKGVIRMYIIRTSTLDNPNGIGIQTYQFDTSTTKVAN